MLNVRLFRMYHSFLIKKWYLLVYIILLLTAFLTALIFISAMSKHEPLKIALVDKDQSSETRLILKAVGDGKSIGDDLKIKHYKEIEAKQLLKRHQLNGYIVFDKGMTDAFYHNGQLPITVYTYDKDSSESIIIKQLTLSVYDRLMLSEGGALTYSKLNKGASEQELLSMLTDMLFTGLNREGVFEAEGIKVYDTTSYYVVSAYFLSIILFFFSLFSLLKMNQFGALKARLQMLHFSFEKLTITRGMIAFIYSAIWSIAGWFLINCFMDTAFKGYNMHTAVIVISCYLILLLCIFVVMDILPGILKYTMMGILIILLLCSGMLLPSIYLEHGMFSFMKLSPFSIILNQLLELILNNYNIDLWPLYISVLSIVLLTIMFLVWRYRR